MLQTDPQYKLRMPPDVKAWLEAEARENSSSVNSEIIRSIRQRMKRETRDTALRPHAEAHAG